MTTSERISLARRLREKNIPQASEYTQAWTSFNAFYNGEPGGDERSRVMNSIRNHMSESQAASLLGELTDVIQFFTRMPPADLRKAAGSPEFRVRSAEALRIVNGSNYSAVEKLACLAAVLYQVRCNLIHGGKDPDNERDRQVVSQSLEALKRIQHALY